MSKLPTCSRQRCKRRPVVAGWCASHAVAEADKRFSLEVRARGICQLASTLRSIACNGGLQTAHIHSRRYRAVRWNRWNALCSCAAHHRWLDLHPLEKEDICRRLLGGTLYDSLRSAAVAGNWRPELEGYLLRDLRDPSEREASHVG